MKYAGRSLATLWLLLALGCMLAGIAGLVQGSATLPIASSLAAILCVFAMKVFGALYRSQWLLASKIDGFEGPCLPTWLNVNPVRIQRDGGVVGSFRLARKVPGLPVYFGVGREFHGRIELATVVRTSACLGGVPSIPRFLAAHVGG